MPAALAVPPRPAAPAASSAPAASAASGAAAVPAALVAPSRSAATAPAPAAPVAGRGCEGVGRGAREFPVVARLRGPEAYRAGGVPRAWVLELTNRSSRACEGLHPVIVLTDRRRALRPAQAALFFFDGRRPRAVDFEVTGRDELVGVFGEEGRKRRGDFGGFTVGAQETVRVRVLLALAPDAVANRVAAEAVVVRRTGRGGADGEWVGRSAEPYRFRIRAAEAGVVRGAPGPGADRDRPVGWGPAAAAGAAGAAALAAAAWCALRRTSRRRAP
ncbi:hypothetical protein [Streptomyces chilikensis]|uniref:DUF4232 domain-containing protein n=1 Tax=Streptomyces chilikensis TaxID=1194079 RepID=A0ABV3EYX1_9ACTN